MTPFQREIRRVVARIPPGQVTSYSAVAALAGRPGAARAVGSALRAVDDEDGLPWWRVVNQAGVIRTSRINHTAQIQRALLEDEGVVFSEAGRIDFGEFGWRPDGRNAEVD